MAWPQGGHNKLSQDICCALTVLISQMQKREAQIAAESAVPLFAMRALHLVDPVVSMTELGKRMGCDPSFVTTIADTLEARGLAEREPNAADRRIKHLVLTANGLEMKSRLQRAMLVEAPWSRLGTTERESFLRLVRKMIDARPYNPAAPTSGRGMQ